MHSGKKFGNVFSWSTAQSAENNFCASYFTPTLEPLQQWQSVVSVSSDRLKRGHSCIGCYSNDTRGQPETGLQHILDIFSEHLKLAEPAGTQPL